MRKNSRMPSAISWLDKILNGVFLSRRSILVRGGPGCGKTTMGLHFLIAGAKSGEAALFISLEESIDNMKAHAKNYGFNLKKINFLDLSSGSDFFQKVESYDIFSAAEVEREHITQKIVKKY